MMFPKFWTQSDIDWSVKLHNSGSYKFYPSDFTQSSSNYSSLYIVMFPNFWTQSDIDWNLKWDNSCSYDVRYEMEWLVYCVVLSIGFHSKHTKRLLPPYFVVPKVLDSIRYRLAHEIGQFRFVRSSFWNGVVPTKFVHKWSGWCIRYFYPLDFTHNSPKDSSLRIMMFPKFWTQSDIDWSLRLDISGSYVVRSEMEWLVYCIVLSLGFHSKLTKLLLPPYYDVPLVLDPIRYRLVHEVGEFRFVRSSFENEVVGVLDTFIHWISLTTHRKTPPSILWCSLSFGLNPISVGPRNWTIQVPTKFVHKWSGWCIRYFYPLDFTHNSPKDSSLRIMMFPKFWTQSDIDWSLRLDISGSYVVRSEMEWLVYCIVLSLGFHSKLTKLLLPPYYDVPLVLDPIRYRLVHEVGEFRFVRSSFENEVVGVLDTFIHWISLTTHRKTPPSILWCSLSFGLNPISVGPRNWTIQVPTKFVHKWSGWCIRYFYPLDFTHNSPKDSSLRIMMFPKFWTQSDIDWSLRLDISGSYVVRSEMEWLVYCIVLSLGFHSKLTKLLLPPYYDVPLVLDPIRYRLVHEVGEFSGWCIGYFYPLDFTHNSPKDSSLHIMVFPKFWTQSDIGWSKKLDNSGSYEVRYEMEWLVYWIVLSIGFHSKLSK
ncbi:unnamed protein product [Prunus armeniaca]